VSIEKIHVDQAGRTLEAFDASGLPGYILFRDGVEIDHLTRLPWLLETRLRRMLNRALD